MRHPLAVLAGAAAAAVGALVLGEYQLTGLTPYLGGLLYGLVVSEVMLAFGPRRSLLLGGLAAALTAAGLGWAIWISTGHGVAPVPAGAWAAVALGVLVSGGRLAGVGDRLVRRRGSGAADTSSRS